MTVKEIAEKAGLSAEEARFLEGYAADGFSRLAGPETDESFLANWENICAYAEAVGAANALNERVCAKRPVSFIAPEGVRIELFGSLAGVIPIVYIKNTADFESFITNLLYKGARPENLSEMGASFVSGKTTRFIVLSSKPYSNVPAEELGLADSADWAEKSMLLRRGHECTHYYTKRFYGASRKHLLDELLADFFGITEAFGFYRSEYFLRFMGSIEGSGGRLALYTDEMSGRVRAAAALLIRTASERLEEISAQKEFISLSPTEKIEKLCGYTLASLCG